MKFGLISDIHGNQTALEAVLTDIEKQGGADEIWVLGDLVALGPDPAEVLDRLNRLPRVRCLRGNTDRYLVSGDRPPPALSQVAKDPSLAPKAVEIAASFAWTLGALAATGWLDFMRALPLSLETRLPNGTLLLGVHASPGLDDGKGFAPQDSAESMLKLLKDCPADLVCTGHTHLPFERRVERWHIVNLGSVSNPMAEDRRASYVLLHADPTGYRVEHRRVAYDWEKVIARLEEKAHPAAGSLRRHFQR
jgi:predicted phosphodiesterase